MEGASQTGAEGRTSLVDSAELALRNWLAPGRHRVGDRLPPEHELASMLGVSRGTLRTALQRLEASGEIVRRQGSGTFVARVEGTVALQEGLERLVPYSQLAERRGVTLTVDGLEVGRRPIGADVGDVFGLPAETQALFASRLLKANDDPAALMLDVIHPSLDIDEDSLAAAVARGEMAVDVLLAAGVAVAYCNTRVLPCLLHPRDRNGKAFGIDRTTAALELLEVMRMTDGDPVQFSRDIFAPDHLELRVLRWMEAEPTLVAPRSA